MFLVCSTAIPLQLLQFNSTWYGFHLQHYILLWNFPDLYSFFYNFVCGDIGVNRQKDRVPATSSRMMSGHNLNFQVSAEQLLSTLDTTESSGRL